MPTIATVPRPMMARKPPHGAPCNACGACCWAALCDLGAAVHKRRIGPCPSLVMRDGSSACGLIETSTGNLRDAAALLINAGNGCDMKLTTEPRDVQYAARMSEEDYFNRNAIATARRLWGME